MPSEDNTGHDDKKLVQEYSWRMYKYLPPAMAIDVEIALLKKVCAGEATSESCEQLLKDSHFREVFLRCWESGSFTEIKSHAKFHGQREQVQIKQGSAGSTVEVIRSLDSGGYVKISNSSFYDIAGDFWNIHYSNDHHETIAKWISQHDQRVTHNAVVKKRATKTGRWFIDSPEFEELCQPRESKRILWCPGIPGVGKTVIASLAIDVLRRHQEDTFIGFIYFDFKLRSLQDLTFVLNSLSRQVFETGVEDITMIFEALYDDHHKRKTQPMVTDLQHAIAGALQMFEHCFFVLDALDEYLDQYNDAKIKELLDILLSLGSHVKLIVTSRPLTGFVNLFEQLNSLQREVEATEQDICHYIKGRLDGHDFNFEICPILRGQIVDGVLKAAKGRFLMAALNMDLLAEQLNLGDLEDTLNALPDGEDAAYSRVMERIGGSSGNRRDIAKKAILLVAYTSEPLSIDELQHALAARGNRYNVQKYLTPLSTITAACAGILVVRGNKIVFVHFTAQEYFDKPFAQAMHFPDANLAISQICLDYLTQGVLSDETLADEFPKEILKQFPFYDYAALKLGSHLNKHTTNNTGSSELQSQIWCFISKNSQAIQHNAAYLLSQANHTASPLYRFFQDREGLGFIPGASLFVSVFYNLPNMVERLLESTTELPQTTCIEQQTPLYYVRWPDQLSIVKAVTKKFGVGLQVNQGTSLLSHLTIYGLEEAVQYILAQPDMDISMLFAGDTTPLHNAVYGGHLSIARYFLDFEANARTNPTYRACPGDAAAQLVDVPDLAPFGCHRTPFQCSVQSKDNEYRIDIPMVKLMLEHVNVNTLNTIIWSTRIGSGSYGGITPLVAAILQTSLPLATLLLEAGAGANVCDEFGCTPLFHAARSGHIEMVKLILQYGGLDTLNAQDENGCTALFGSACHFSQRWQKTEEHAEHCVLFLLQQSGIDIHLADHNGCTPLYYAHKAGFTSKVVPILENHGVQLLPNGTDLPADFLCTAAEDGVELVIKLMLERTQITVEPRNAKGATPLLLACQKPHKGIVELLLHEPWVDVNAQDSDGRTPLHYAFYEHHISVVQMLLQQSAIDVTKQDNAGRNCLTAFIGLSPQDPTLEQMNLLLVQYKALASQLNCQDSYGNTPIFYASITTSKLLNMFLGVLGVNLTITNHAGQTHLMAACSGCLIPTPHPLRWESWDTNLYIGTGEDKAKAIYTLLDKDASQINAQDSSGRTALSWAIWCLEKDKLVNLKEIQAKAEWWFPKEYDVKQKVAALLARTELDVNLPDNEGKTPLWYAQQLGYDRVARMLMARGAMA